MVVLNCTSSDTILDKNMSYGWQGNKLWPIATRDSSLSSQFLGVQSYRFSSSWQENKALGQRSYPKGGSYRTVFWSSKWTITYLPCVISLLMYSQRPYCYIKIKVPVCLTLFKNSERPYPKGLEAQNKKSAPFQWCLHSQWCLLLCYRWLIEAGLSNGL